MILDSARAIIILALFFGLPACATSEPEVRTLEFRAPVAVSCVPEETPPAPEYPDTAEALRQADPDNRYSLLQQGWLLRGSRLTVLEAILAGCR